MAAAAAGATSLWWDTESCSLPSYVNPYVVVSMASALLRNFNIVTSMVNAGRGCSSLDDHHFSAYAFFKETETELHQTLINSGIRLHQLPPGKTSNEMEKVMMADVLLWAMDTPPPANIIIIVGSVDLCYVIQKLRQRSYNVFMVCQSMSIMPQGMLGGVNNCLGWLSFLRSLQNEHHQPHVPGRISVYDHTLSKTAFPAASNSISNRAMEDSNTASYFNYSQENLFCLQTSLSCGQDSTCFLPLDETAGSSPVLTEPGFHGHCISTEKPRSPVSSASSIENKGSGSLEEFKAWLAGVVNGIEHAENGYNISHIHMDFEKATRKILDKELLGFSNIRNLVDECKDIAVLKEVRQGCHFAFPPELSTQRNLVSSPGGLHRNPSLEVKPKVKTDPKLKQKASAEDFREFISQMLLAGEFSQGFVLGRLRHKFEEQTGKVLDVKHLGYKNLSKLVASYSHLLSVDNAEVRQIFPSGFVSEAKVETDRPSSGGSGKELLKNRVWEETLFNKQLPYMNSESEWLPSVTTGLQASVSFSPYRETNSPAFQEHNSIKSDSSSTSGGSQVSEREGHSSNTISDTALFHGELKGSEFIKQHVSTLQWQSNDPIEDSVNAKCLTAETMQNMTLMKENAIFCGEPSIYACTLGLPDWNSPRSESSSSETQASHNSRLADPLHSRSRGESSAFCVEDLRYGIRFDCKQNKVTTQNNNPLSSTGRVNCNLSPEFKPKAETYPKLKQKASAEEFREFINQMLLAGEFSQGFLLGNLRRKFEEKTGKVLDVKHLGYKKLSKLVASYSHLLSVENAGTTLSRIFPTGFVSEAVPSNPNNTASKVTSMNTNLDPTKLKAKVEADCPSSGVSGKELLQNRAWEDHIFNKQFLSMNSESQCLPSMPTGPRASVSFSPYREANGPAFQECIDIKSNSSNAPGGSQVSEREGQSSDTIGDMISLHRELEGSDFVKQHVSTLQLENNDPIEDLVNVECPVVEAMQNMSLKKENAIFCGERSIHACTLELSDWNPPLSEFASSEPHAGCNSPPADPLQRRSRAESSAFCAEDLRYGIKLDCKQNELNSQENHVSPPGGVNQNTSSESKPKAEADPKLKQKASAEDFREFINQMLLDGEFSQGFLLGHLRRKFEDQSGKVLDVKHLGYKKLSKLVASYSHLLLVDNADTRSSRIFPTGFVNEAVPNNPNSNTTSKAISMNISHDPTELKAKVEADCPSSGVSGKELLENRAWEENIFNKQLPYMNSASECLPSMTTGPWASVSFSPYGKANGPAFQEYNNITSDSLSTPEGSQVSEREGQSSNTISDMMSFHGELEGSDFMKQHVSLSTLQLENNDPIENLGNAECPVVEAIQNMNLRKENAIFCGEPSIHACTLGLPNWNPPLSESPNSEPHAGCNSPLVDPLQSRSSAESSAFCAEDLRYGIRLDCIQNDLNTQEIPVSSLGGVNLNPTSESKPIVKTDTKLKQKASAEDFKEFISQMLLAGEFSQGFVLGRLHHKFEEKTGKVLDVKHLGHKKLSQLVASYSHLLSVDNAGTEFSQIFPAGFVGEAVSSNRNSNTTSKVTSMNTNHDPIKLKAKVEEECPSSGVSGKELLENRACDENIYIQQFPYTSSENEWLPDMTTGSQPLANFSPRQADSPAFQECDIKSDLASTPGVFQIGEWEGQSSTTISETSFFHGEQSDCINLVLALQRDDNIPIEEPVNAKRLIAEDMENRRQMIENTSFYREPSIPTCTRLPDWILPPYGSPSSEPQVGCISPHAPMQSRVESNAVCTEDSRDSIRLDRKQNEQNTKNGGDEERSIRMTSAVSSAGSIIQVAGRGLKSICELTMWRKNR